MVYYVCVCVVAQVRLEWPTDLAINPLDNSLYILDNNIVLQVEKQSQMHIIPIFLSELFPCLFFSKRASASGRDTGTICSRRRKSNEIFLTNYSAATLSAFRVSVAAHIKGRKRAPCLKNYTLRHSSISY